VAQHQANHARILKLRQTTESLDSQIKSTVATLAQTRKELLAIPSAPEPDIPTRDVPFDELLAFAKNIAKFTLPPGHHLRPPKPQEPTTENVVEPLTELSIMNGGPPQSPTQPSPAPTQSQDKDGAKKDTEGQAFSQLTEEQRAFLEDAQTLPFMPWPDHNLINQGILRHVQELIMKGIDPATVKTDAEQAAWEEEIHEQRAKLQAAERQHDQERRVQQVPKEGAKTFEGFAFLEDDDDMEE
jgi:Vitamin-D-receptor interacting Mediator subunit 4